MTTTKLLLLFVLCAAMLCGSVHAQSGLSRTPSYSVWVVTQTGEEFNFPCAGLEPCTDRRDLILLRGFDDPEVTLRRWSPHTIKYAEVVQ